MKVDTGADVTVFSLEEDFSSIRPKPQLDISRRVLRGPDGKPLHVLGAFNAPMSIDSRFDRSSRHTIYVIRGLHTSLLGRPAIQALHVLQRPQVDSLSAMATDNPGYKNNVISDYPQLFTGLGEMHGTPHHIHLADNATPNSLSMPRRVPLHAHCQGGCYSRQNGVTRRYPPGRRTNRVWCGHGRRTKIER